MSATLLLEETETKCRNETNRRPVDLQRSAFAPVLNWLYRVFNCRRRWRVARVLLAAAQRLEGGAMRSATAREFMQQHGVTVGAYSYGDCFDPAIIPPGVVIGRYVSIARGVRFFTQNHPLDQLTTHPVMYERQPGVAESGSLPPGRLEIGHDVWIGCNALITPGCRRVGTGAVIGAGAVVTRDVPEFAIVAGNPARKLRDRFSPEVADRLRASEWWNLSADELIGRLPELNGLLQHDSTSTEIAGLAGTRN